VIQELTAIRLWHGCFLRRGDSTNTPKLRQEPRGSAESRPKAFEVNEQSQREARLARENAWLKTLVGELTLELKKSDEVLG
jgi:hypothetical protein